MLAELPAPVFLADEYDVSELAGARGGAAVQLRHRPGPGPAGLVHRRRHGHRHRAERGAVRLFVTDFETWGGPDDARIFNGGCREDLDHGARVHARLELRRRRRRGPRRPRLLPGDAGPLGLRPRRQGPDRPRPDRLRAGLSMVYTDEAHGYGNVGTDDPPAQSPLDSQPEPGERRPTSTTRRGPRPPATPASPTPAPGTPTTTPTRPRRSRATPTWRTRGASRYDCLGFDVTSMSGEADGPPRGRRPHRRRRLHDGRRLRRVRLRLRRGRARPGNTAPDGGGDGDAGDREAGRKIQFSAAGTTDAETPDDLDYSWDFGNGGTTKDAAGRTVPRLRRGGHYRHGHRHRPAGATDTARRPSR